MNILNTATYFGSGEEHERGAFEDGTRGAHLRSPPLVFEIVLPVARHVRKVHHFAAELTERFDKFGEIVDAFQPRQRVRYLNSF